MKIAVSRAPVVGYSFMVEKDDKFETTDDVIKACLQLERELMVKDEEKEDE